MCGGGTAGGHLPASRTGRRQTQKHSVRVLTSAHCPASLPLSPVTHFCFCGGRLFLIIFSLPLLFMCSSLFFNISCTLCHFFYFFFLSLVFYKRRTRTDTQKHPERAPSFLSRAALLTQRCQRKSHTQATAAPQEACEHVRACGHAAGVK